MEYFAVAAALLSALTWAAATGGAPPVCEVSLFNVAGTMTMEGEGAGAEVRIFAAPLAGEVEVALPAGTAAAEWEALLGAVDAVNLRLLRAPTPGEHWAGAGTGAKIVEVGRASVWRDLAKMRLALRPGAPLPRPPRLKLRRDVLVGVLPSGGSLDWSAGCGQTLELEADGAEAVLGRVWRAGAVLFATQDGAVRVLPTSALLRPPKGDALPSWQEVRERVRGVCSAPFADSREEAEYFCGPWQDHRLHVLSRHDVAEAYAQGQLEEFARRTALEMQTQERGFRHLTADGFAVRRGPTELLERVRGYYRRERLRSSSPEMGEALNPTLAMRESDVWSMELPEALREELDASLRPLVEEWAGLGPGGLQTPTIIHGPRLYHNGSRLRAHVDNSDTHAFGVIVHVGHEGLGQEAVRWPFSIVDHAGATHTMAADDVEQVVLYESATCRHWREGLFVGREFANIFVHYAPVGWPEAYAREPAAPRTPEL